MNWQDLKASLVAFFQSFSLSNQYHQEPELKPIPVESKPAHPRPSDRR